MDRKRTPEEFICGSLRLRRKIVTETVDHYLNMDPIERTRQANLIRNRLLQSSNEAAGYNLNMDESGLTRSSVESNPNVEVNLSPARSSSESSIDIEQDFIPSLGQYERVISDNESEGSAGEESEEDDPNDDCNEIVASKMRELVVDGMINVTVTNILLRMMNTTGKLTLPKDYWELMDVAKKTKQPTKISGGDYIHMGIETNLSKLKYSFFEVDEKVTLDISFDAVPGFSSSNKQIWVISGGLVNRRVDPFMIGVFVGDKKPENPGQFFYNTLSEIDRLRAQGVLVGCKKKRMEFTTRAFIADTPARCFATGALGHSGKNSCPVCTQRAERIGNYTVFSSKVGTMRTNDSFRNRLDPEYNK